MFLFDEPFGALDEITRERLNDELLALFLAQGFAGAVHHPLDLRGGVPVDPGLVMSGRPGRIVGDFDVPFEYPRRPTCGSSPSSPSSPARSPTRSAEAHS